MFRSGRHIQFIKSEKNNLGNPFRFQGIHAPRVRAIPAFGLLLIILAALVYWALFSGPLAITKVRVESNFTLPIETLTQKFVNQLSALRWSFVPQRNIFAFNARALSKTISEQFLLGDVRVKKNLPHEIVLTIAEKPREILWSARGQLYALDPQGFILGTTEIKSGDTKTVIYDQSGAVPEAHAKILAPAMLNFVSTIVRNARVTSLKPQFFILANSRATEITLKVGEGWNIKFDTTQNPDTQLKNLDIILRNSIAPDALKRLEYIDLRFGEKTYYKFK